MVETATANAAFARALSAFVRAEFETPVASLRGLIDILIEDASASGCPDAEGDLPRMRDAADRLLGLVSGLLDRADAGDIGHASAAVRHDLRTPVTAILGYGELIAEEAQDRGDDRLVAPLGDVLKAARSLLNDFDKLVSFSTSDSRPSAPGATMPDGLRHAVAVVRQLSQHEPAAGKAITGKILVVDDNASMRDLVSRRLIREGHEVAVCSSGTVALEMTATGHFDLMLLDLMMPGISGLEVLDRLRAQDRADVLPVIVMSALDDVDAAVRCIEAGADDFLSKPLNETLLRARIGSSLERKFLRDREQDALSRLKQEQLRSEALLGNILPASVVDRLRGGETVVADHFDEVTVLFCDLVGFTALSASLQPAEVLALLNDVFLRFDALAEDHGLEKIKTIGDAYMAVGGLFAPIEDHAKRTVDMACRMAAAVAAADGRHGLGVRIGIDTGPAVAGIIGRHKFFYDVWGDTVNTASRLEASAAPGQVHISQATRWAIRDHFDCEARAPIEIKGKGLMQTFHVAARLPR